VMGTVILTTEFPYTEPISEPVEPGLASVPQTVPTAEAVAKLAASMGVHPPTKSPPAVTESQARRAIQRQYDAWSRAYMAHDVDTLLGILAPDYLLKTAKGATMTRAEYEVMLRLRKKKHSDTTRYRTELLRLTLHDGVAAVFSRETTTDRETNPKTGKPESVSYQHDYIDAWVLSNGRWRLQSTVTQKETPLTPPKAQPRSR